MNHYTEEELREEFRKLKLNPLVDITGAIWDKKALSIIEGYWLSKFNDYKKELVQSLKDSKKKKESVFNLETGVWGYNEALKDIIQLIHEDK